MAKKKIAKKNKIDEEIQQEIVTFENANANTEDSSLHEPFESIEPIDMSEELEEMKKEIFDEPIKKEEEIVAEEKPKETVTEKITHKMSSLFGFVWNGMEYD